MEATAEEVDAPRQGGGPTEEVEAPIDEVEAPPEEVEAPRGGEGRRLRLQPVQCGGGGMGRPAAPLITGLSGVGACLFQ